MKTLSTLLFIFLAATANAQRYIPQDENSKVGFTIVNHMLVRSTVNGTLRDLKGSIFFNPADLRAAAFDVSVNVGTIRTGIGKRDEDIKKESFFNADKFPAIRIVSTRVEKGKNPGTYMLYGNLTMKGITKQVAIPFTISLAPGGLLFKGDFMLNRLDYTVGEKGKIEDQVKVDLSVQAKLVK